MGKLKKNWAGSATRTNRLTGHQIPTLLDVSAAIPEVGNAREVLAEFSSRCGDKSVAGNIVATRIYLWDDCCGSEKSLEGEIAELS